MFEKIIYNELRYRGYKVDVGVVEIREKDEKGKEVKKQVEIDLSPIKEVKGIIFNPHILYRIKTNGNKKPVLLTRRGIHSKK